MKTSKSILNKADLRALYALTLICKNREEILEIKFFRNN